ncbi:MAG: hypothetical protein V7644_2763 [Actinomycetota bacterium]|jgi:hypothetical protein
MPNPHPEPPGVGRYRPDHRLGKDQHGLGWSNALENAADNIQRDPGTYTVNVALSAVVEVENPGHVIEYIVKLT